MGDPVATRPLAASIAAVERDTGLSKDTLRVWERRYGFPTPDRDGFGERAYPLEQVEKLRAIKRLLDTGHRPGRIVPLSMDDLHRLGEGMAGGAAARNRDTGTSAHPMLALLHAHDLDGLRHALHDAQLRLGLSRFLTEVVGPLNVLVGDTWMRGQLQVFEEHMYAELLQVVLRNAIHSVPQPPASARPRVLLTTFPQEAHGLGLLMVEPLLALEGCKCISLGTQTPMDDIVLAAAACRADTVALSFTASLNHNLVIDGLAELRRKLPEGIEIWAGGQCPALLRRDVPGVVTVGELDAVRPQVARWRAGHAGQG
jgi:MerR family transcriptional regulator, light-induced transcriptional regulator